MALQIEQLNNGTVLLKLDRPEQRNAFDTELLESIIEQLETFARSTDTRALVFSTTNVQALSAGADVAEKLDAAEGVRRMELFADMYAAVDAFPAPTIAVCVGNVVGAGAELALGCDLRVGGDNLKFVMVGGKLGVPVGPARLIPLVGLSVAKDLLLTGRTVDLEEAASLHLVHRSAAADEAEAVALKLADELTEHSAPGLRQIKRLIRQQEATDMRIERENEVLIEFQRNGGGLPSYD